MNSNDSQSDSDITSRVKRLFLLLKRSLVAEQDTDGESANAAKLVREIIGNLNKDGHSLLKCISIGRQSISSSEDCYPNDLFLKETAEKLGGAFPEFAQAVKEFEVQQEQEAIVANKQSGLLSVSILYDNAQIAQADGNTDLAGQFGNQAQEYIDEFQFTPNEIGCFLVERERMLLDLLGEIAVFSSLPEDNPKLPERFHKKAKMGAKIAETALQYGYAITNSDDDFGYTDRFNAVAAAYGAGANEVKAQIAQRISEIEKQYGLKSSASSASSSQASASSSSGPSAHASDSSAPSGKTSANSAGAHTHHAGTSYSQPFASSPPPPSETTIFPVVDFNGKSRGYTGAPSYTAAVVSRAITDEKLSLTQQFKIEGLTPAGVTTAKVRQQGTVSGLRLNVQEIVWSATPDANLTDGEITSQRGAVTLGTASGVKIEFSDAGGSVKVQGDADGMQVIMPKEGTVELLAELKNSALQLSQHAELRLGEKASAINVTFLGTMPITPVLPEPKKEPKEEPRSFPNLTEINTPTFEAQPQKTQGSSGTTDAAIVLDDASIPRDEDVLQGKELLFLFEQMAMFSLEPGIHGLRWDGHDKKYSHAYYNPRFWQLEAKWAAMFGYLFRGLLHGYEGKYFAAFQPNGDTLNRLENFLVKAFELFDAGKKTRTGKIEEGPFRMLVQPLLVNETDWKITQQEYPDGNSHYRIHLSTNEINIEDLAPLLSVYFTRNGDFGYPPGYFNKLEGFLGKDGFVCSIDVSVRSAKSPQTPLYDLITPESFFTLDRKYFDRGLQLPDGIVTLYELVFTVEGINRKFFYKKQQDGRLREANNRLDTPGLNKKRAYYDACTSIEVRLAPEDLKDAPSITEPPELDYIGKLYPGSKKTKVSAPANSNSPAQQAKMPPALSPTEEKKTEKPAQIITYEGRFFRGCVFNDQALTGVDLSNFKGNSFFNFKGKDIRMLGKWSGASFQDSDIVAVSEGDLTLIKLNNSKIGFTGDGILCIREIVSIDSGLQIKGYNEVIASSGRFKGKELVIQGAGIVDLSNSSFTGCKISIKGFDSLNLAGAIISGCNIEFDGKEVDISGAVISAGGKVEGKAGSIFASGAQIGSDKLYNGELTVWDPKVGSMTIQDLRLGSVHILKNAAVALSAQQAWNTVQVIGSPVLEPAAEQIFKELANARNFTGMKGPFVPKRGVTGAETFKLTQS